MPTDDKSELLRRRADLTKAPAKRLEGIGGRTSITTSAGRKDFRERLLVERQELDHELRELGLDPNKLPAGK